MEPETSPTVNPPSDSDKVTMTLSDLKALIKDAVSEAVAPLAQINSHLQEQVAKVNELGYAEGVPEQFRRGDPTVNPDRMSVARSVTIATRPVRENPEQYANVVDPGGLSINNASPLSPKAMAECFREPNGSD